MSKKDRNLIFVKVAALMWAIWCMRNDTIFEKKQFTSFMQHEEARKTVCLASKTLEVVVLNIFAKNI
ncbi:hypothetical protein SETIT_6G182300v2 [Setaria italica]|uniref:Uncharacterized protein n=1 Tax=Setaria italica TaxID=4555 RepID=A0A368RN79_SETIT|nr:hypothetical protein SETIT_6G182300v2 [Setaria italica]